MMTLLSLRLHLSILLGLVEGIDNANDGDDISGSSGS